MCETDFVHPHYEGRKNLPVFAHDGSMWSWGIPIVNYFLLQEGRFRFLADLPCRDLFLRVTNLERDRLETGR